MNQSTKLVIASLLSIAVIGGVSWIDATGIKSEQKSESSEKNNAAKAKDSSTVKSDVHSNIDINDLMEKSDLNVRYIDVFGAMRECKEGMQESEKLEAVRKDLASNIQGEAKKLESAMAKYKSEASTLNDSARSKKEQELTKMKRDYESTVQSSEEEMKLAMQQVTEQLAKEIEQAVVEVAKVEGLDAVVDRMTGRVIYVAEKVDYTARVVKIMNKNYDYKLANNGKAKSATAVASNKKNAAAAAA